MENRIFTAEQFSLTNSLNNTKVEAKKNHFGEYGVFATTDIPQNEVLTVFVGTIMTLDQANKLPEELLHYPLQIADNAYIGIDSPEVIDLGEYYNHSCTPNAGIIGNNILVAMKAITKGEEICFDYAMTESGEFSFSCKCGSPQCRGTISSEDWKRNDLQEKYRGYFGRYLQKKIDNK